MGGSDSFICIFHREIDADRYLNLQTTLRYYHDKLPELEIILVEEDKEQKLRDIPSWVDYHFLYNPGGFSQGWAVNYAAKLSKRPIGVSICNDAILKLHTFQFAENEIRRNRWGCYIPYNEFYNLTPLQTEKFRRDYQIDWTDDGLLKRYGPNPPEKAGGAIFFDREVFLDIGGFNEVFRGYGAEDDEFSFRCKWLGTYSSCKDPQWNLYHLYHPTFRDHTWGNDDWLKNYNIYMEIRGMKTQEDWTRYMRGLKQVDIGNPKKFET